MNNTTISKDIDGEKLALQYVIPGSVTALTAFVINVGFIVIGVQSLKKTFHNLLVLLLCLNDGMLSLVYVVFTILKGIPVGQRSHIICGGFLVVMAYGFLTSFVVIFMLGFARFVRIRTLNPSTTNKLEKYKYLILVLMYLVSLSLVLIVHVSTMQISHRIKACNLANFYGRNYKIYILCLWVPISLLVVAIVLMYIFCSYFLWQVFFKGKDTKNKANKLSYKIAPSKYIVEVDEDAKAVHEHVEPQWIETSFGPSNLSKVIPQSDLKKEKNIVACENHEPIFSVDGENQEKWPNAMFRVDGKTQEELPKTMSSVDGENQAEWTETMVRVDDENQAEWPKTMLRGMGIDWSGGSCRVSSNKTINQQDKWEVRAFKTNLLVASTTVCLCGPFIATLLYDLVANDTMPVRIRHIVFTLNGISHLLDPFIYAFRVPEIRREIKKEMFATLTNNAEEKEMKLK